MKTSFQHRVSEAWQRNPFLFLFGLGFFLLPVSNAAGQVPLYLGSVGWCLHAFRARTRVPRLTLFWVVGFAILILLSLSYSIRPMNGLEKLNRLLLFPIALAIPVLLNGESDPGARLRDLVLSFCMGVGILGLYDLVRVPLEMSKGVSLFDTGSMTSPQFYMVGLILWLGLARSPAMLKVPLVLRLGMLALMVGGLLVHNKRGTWLACLLALACWVVLTRRWRMLAAMFLICLLGLAMPQVRERLADLEKVIKPEHGGRMTLWTYTAPALLPEYPLGMGYAAPEFEDFRAVTDSRHHIEEGLDHLHNNVLQIRLELGWHGVMFWSCWMLSALGGGLWAAWKCRAIDPDDFPEHSSLAIAFSALLLNGFVEYNFGDSEILMVYLLLLGCLAGLTSAQQQPGSTHEQKQVSRPVA